MVTTFILGLLVSITFGLLLIPISIIWTILFLYPLLGLSYVFERVTILKPFISLVGIFLAFIGDTYVSLMPSMGEMESRYEKLIMCQTFPYTFKYLQFRNNKLNINRNDVLTEILRNISKAEPLKKHLNELRADVYSRIEYTSGKYDGLDW
jgi:hypothetical protein